MEEQEAEDDDEAVAEEADLSSGSDMGRPYCSLEYCTRNDNKIRSEEGSMTKN